MTILVIGESGQLARSLAQAGAESGVPLVTAGRPKLDLLDKNALVGTIEQTRPSAVINAAAYTAVDKAETETDAAFALNAQAVEFLGLACAKADIPLLHMSTDYVFDGSKADPYVETDTVSPINAYGRSKLAGEELLRAAHRKHVILRTAWVYSPYGNNFLNTMLRVGATRREVTVVDDQRGNPTYAPHLASALLAIAHRVCSGDADELWGTYHATGSGEATWCQFAQEIFDIGREHGLNLGNAVPITTSQYPTPARRPANSRLDNALLQQRFGVKLPDWRVGTRDCIAHIMALADVEHSERGT